MSTRVVPVFRFVPNGLVSDGNVTRLAVTILATPTVPTQDTPAVAFEDAPIYLENWPSAINQVVR